MAKSILQTMASDIAELKRAMLSVKTVFNIDEACEYLGLTKGYLYKQTSAGIIPHSRPSGGKLYFSKIDLDAWMLSNKTNGIEQTESAASTYITTHN